MQRTGQRKCLFGWSQGQKDAVRELELASATLSVGKHGMRCLVWAVHMLGPLVGHLELQ